MRNPSVPARVVIVDDSLYTRHILRQIFEHEGWEVVGEAENGREAITLVTSLQPDFVTMDITMPEMNGIMAVREIIRLDPSVCIVMCSALGQQDQIVEAVRAGARGFIAKPFKPERVRSAAIDAMKSSRVAAAV